MAKPQQEPLTPTDTTKAQVYNATTKPKKPKRRDKSDLGPDFVAPDGGWGWVVCIAAGISNLSIFPALQQYGLVYRQRFAELNFDAKQTTTIVNAIMAISALVGIVNGAMFRRFTFRQVGLFGSLLIFIGIFASAFCTTFGQYIFFFSCVYGIGLGLSVAATSLAVNTYFKNRRRRATGYSWTITGLGPIIFPHISTFFLVYYGVQGTILLISGLALNAFLCAMTLQPVLWHVKKPEKPQLEQVPTEEPNGNCIEATKDTTALDIAEEYECKFCQLRRQGKSGIFASQHHLFDDELNLPEYEPSVPDTPMLARANDGWFGSKISLASEMDSRYRFKVLRQASLKEDRPKYLQQREHPLPEYYASKQSVYSKGGTGDHAEVPTFCTCAEEKALLQNVNKHALMMQAVEELKAAEAADELAKSKMTIGQKIIKFFDLDLLRDFTFVNLAMGMTIMMFGEMNFSVLTPFILHQYGFTNEQMSLAMSVLGGVDISVRFFAPFFLEKVKLDNRVLFAFGIITLSVGRLLVTMTRDLNVVLVIFVLIGFGKGFRTIFQPLIIPSYVPLHRLPAASGLQLIFTAIFSASFGPILGIVTDAYSYTATIHFINFLTLCALLMWFGEALVRRILNSRKNAAVAEVQ